MSRPRQRYTLEAGQKLDINALLRSGAMRRPANGEKAGSLRVSYPTIGFEQEINFVSRKRNFGGRQYYFLCPATGRLCSVLWKPAGTKQLLAGRRGATWPIRANSPMRRRGVI